MPPKILFHHTVQILIANGIEQIQAIVRAALAIHMQTSLAHNPSHLRKGGRDHRRIESKRLHGSFHLHANITSQCGIYLLENDTFVVHSGRGLHPASDFRFFNIAALCGDRGYFAAG